MSAGDYYAPVTGTAWQPPAGWHFTVGDPPNQMPPFTWYPNANASPPRMPDRWIETSTGAGMPTPSAQDDRIAALESEVKRLSHECKRLQ
jgi:hypothetical protein